MLWNEWLANVAIELRPDDIRVDVIHAAAGDHRRYWVRGLKFVDTEQLVSNLRQQGGAIGRIVDDHEAEYGDVLLHLLIADLRRCARNAFDASSTEVLHPLLDLLADAFEQADAPVQNAIAVSFVEDSCPWERTASAFVAVWPRPLRDEARRQLESRS